MGVRRVTDERNLACVGREEGQRLRGRAVREQLVTRLRDPCRQRLPVDNLPVEAARRECHSVDDCVRAFEKKLADGAGA